ncbi:MAG: cell division protein FtsH [Candidatus Abawacabacteria bacterium RIFCSPHIGHO2_01_FULL_46_8]|uniref:ATP-dependent zinc metalloprotease FtsH n=1 Tax=Candidatus Abawacabacteria bacterium RIFCSPHIGHO2_01_FULL_46_8 TaxID=1817815 RepID=A0A1F4XK47_9BACT|nr:MAG: cell division protein FtsH [Candidatus Abawacabacteria bacterium RIFCSPHIGHO2_01_FULL_46_8]
MALRRRKPGQNFLWLLLVVIIIAAIYSFGSRVEQVRKVPLSYLQVQYQEGNVERIVVEGNELIGLLRNGERIAATKEATANVKDLGFDPQKVEIEVKDLDGSRFWTDLLLSLIPFVLIGVFLIFMIRQAQSGSQSALTFGKSRARLHDTSKKKVLFEDVAGCEEAKEELVEVVDFLKYPAKYTALGAKIPKGVMLVGAPGTGKTLLARAVAGEANVPFFSISGSEFVEMFVGVGASRVRDLFNKAKKNSPCIVFIDEIDAVGRQRGAGLGGGNDEREQTLNQILVEMDGFEQDTNVIVVAATNRPDVLDPALLRTGRFDRRVILDMPDMKAREAILKVHARGKPIKKGVDFEHVAKITAGFSGADLENLMNEAAILTARLGEKKISEHAVDISVDKVMLGPERKSHVLNSEEKKITAYHEAGHALVAHSLPHCDPVQKVSVVARGVALGVTWFLPEHDRKLESYSKFRDDLASMLGGYSAEKLIFGEVTTGASNDLERATKLAKAMVVRFGMSEKLGPIGWGEGSESVFLGRELAEQKNYSEGTAQEIDGEISRIINDAFTRAKEILSKKRKTLAKIVTNLLKTETLTGKEFAHLAGHKAKKLSNE